MNKWKENNEFVLGIDIYCHYLSSVTQVSDETNKCALGIKIYTISAQGHPPIHGFMAATIFSFSLSAFRFWFGFVLFNDTWSQ